MKSYMNIAWSIILCLFLLPIQDVNAQLCEWQSISSGGLHSIGMKSDGTIWAWGYNTVGQLGDGTTTNRYTPVKVGFDTDWQSIIAASGGGHTLALKTNGTLWAWGRNTRGQFGDGTNTSQNAPVQVSTITNWQSIAAGGDHTAGVQSDGTLWTWGDNTYNQLGDGTNISQNAPIQIGSATNWQSVHCGTSNTFAIKTDGTLWAWGDNGYGQLGDGTNIRRSTPVQIGAATNWESVSASGFHTGGLRTDGTIWTWANNDNGQLGQGTITNTNSPAQVGSDTDWQSISIAGSHTVCLKTDGTLWSFGRNLYGQLGDGTNGAKTTPTQIGTATNWQSASAGGRHTEAIRFDNIYSWGSNQFGQLGDGTTIHRNVPTLIEPSLDVPNKGIVETLTALSSEDIRGWTYYLHPNIAGKHIFAINWAPDGSLSAANATAKTNAEIVIDIMATYDSASSGMDASYLMARYWNVNNAGVFDESVDIKFYYDTDETQELMDAANAYSLANSSSSNGLRWFKMNASFDPSIVNNATFQPDAYLNPTQTGEEYCQNFVRFNGLTSFSGGGAGAGTGTALPVELLNFRAKNEGKSNYLFWTTVSENNNAGFYVERSMDGRDFENIGFVEGNGNSAQKINYTFIDQLLQKGIHYYRLKQMDFDGKYEYSSIIQIQVDQQNLTLGNIYPNPSKKQLVNIDYMTNESLDMMIQIIDIAGKTIRQQQIKIQRGNHRLDIDCTHLENGIYMIQFKTKNATINRKVIIR